jgi:hypothetical protein
VARLLPRAANGLDVLSEWVHHRGVDQKELPGMPAVQPLRKWSKGWRLGEWNRYAKLCRDHRGLTTPAFAGVILGVSRQRVYELMEYERLTVHDILERKWLQVDEVEAFAKLERDNTTRYAGRYVT